MYTAYPGIYHDEHGEERITIENDGKTLSTVIRSVRFEGFDFDSLEPQKILDDTHSHLFTLASGSLCNCILEFEMPLSIATNSETVIAALHASLKLGKPKANGGIDQEVLQLKLSWPNHVISSQGKSGWFLDELTDLQTAMPTGFFIKCCVNCAFSNYSPLGFGIFGCLACFRENKQGILAVCTKGDLFQVWSSMTEFVQETYLCPEFQSKI